MRKRVPLYEGGELAVSDTFATGAVARSFQTCSLQFRCDRSCCKEVENLFHMRQMLLQGKNLHTLIQMQ